MLTYINEKSCLIRNQPILLAEVAIGSKTHLAEQIMSVTINNGLDIATHLLLVKDRIMIFIFLTLIIPGKQLYLSNVC